MTSPFKGRTGLIRLSNALRYSASGLAAAFRTEQAFRQELLAVLLLAPVAVLSNTSPLEKALLLSSLLLVVIIELVNSAIEATVDRISTERHALAKQAKDIGSAAVLLALINAACVWGFIFLG